MNHTQLELKIRQPQLEKIKQFKLLLKLTRKGLQQEICIVPWEIKKYT